MGADAGFLGSGWRFPPRFGANGAGVATVSALDDIRQSLEILLGTAQGERVMREDFGADLRSFQFAEIDQALINRIRGQVSDAILYHEPRVVLEHLEVGADPRRPGVLRIGLGYRVRSTNSRYNLVYPFYLDEAAADA